MMTTRVAALLLASTAACLSGTDDDLQLDDLPSYDEDTGGGKADDPNCTDVSYRAFIKSYMRDDAPATANPCPNGNDASYRIWTYVAGQKLKPMFDAYDTARRKRHSNLVTRDQVIAAGTIDETTMEVLTKLEAVQPAHAGRIGVQAWITYLYKPALDRATMSVGTSQLSPDSRDQLSNEITSFEEPWLGFVERAQPIATAPKAWALWWTAAKLHFADATSSMSNTFADHATINAAFVARLGETKPAGAFDEDGATFQTEFTTKMGASYKSSTPSAAPWMGSLPLKPSGGGILSYKTWASTFATIAADFSSRTRGDAQRDLFKQIIALRPCGSGSEVDVLATKLETRLATAGNDPSGTPLSEVAVPTACP